MFGESKGVTDTLWNYFCNIQGSQEVSDTVGNHFTGLKRSIGKPGLVSTTTLPSWSVLASYWQRKSHDLYMGICMRNSDAFFSSQRDNLENLGVCICCPGSVSELQGSSCKVAMKNSNIE